MFKFFKKKSERDILQSKYDKLMKESFELSRTNRTEGDKKYAEADEIMKRIQALEKDDK